MDLSMATCNAERASMKSSEYRKVIKPLLERRRRARINNCLDELKALILETAQPENTDASKLEKADILELTVQHLRNLRHGRRPWAPVKTEQEEGLRGPVPHGVDKFRAGFAECAHEVSSFICALNGVETEVKSRLVSHLAHCVNRMSPTSTPPTSAPQPNTTLPVLPPVPVPAPHQHMDNTQFCRVPVMTPTPPPSPVSPLTPCGTPTTNHISSRDYLIPVSPVSQPESAPYHHHHQQQQQHLHQNHQHGHYGSFIRNNFVRGDVYVWPDVVRSVSRSSSVDTPNSYEDCYSDREESVAPISPASSTSYGSSYRPVMEVHFQAKSEEKPWRPW